MKKQNNILAYTKQAFNAMLAILLFTACTDEVLNDSQVEEGVPVEVNFEFAASTMKAVNTRLSDSDEFQVNDLYLLIFNSKGEKKEGSQYFNSGQLGHTNGTQSNPTKGTLSNVKTTSGTSYIYAIANVSGNELDRKGTLKTQLDNINSIEQLKALHTILNNDGNIGRSSATLLMSGTFYSTGSSAPDQSEGKCIIPTTNSKISGELRLRRLDSYIKFAIKLGDKIKSFDLQSWQVYNVPTNANLIAQTSNYAEAKYSNSGEQMTRTVENNIYSFEFYMQENLKKVQNEGEMKTYKDREKELKNDLGKNTGVYKFVEPGATFVEIKAKMNIVNPHNPTDGIRTADVRYIVHLGGGETDFKNFNSERNKKYTYNITINDVNEIIVEVEKGEDAEGARPGSEGDVVDSQTQIYTLDSHYNCFNIKFTKEDNGNLSFIIQSPFAPDAVYSERGFIGALENTPKEDGDYKWISFQRTTTSTTLAKYNNNTTPIDLYELAADLNNRIQNAPTSNEYWYTVFINEYYYETPPAKATMEWTDTQHYWRYFVNKPNRNLLLFLAPKYSADGESSYSTARYMISQRSIQTYYSTENLNSNGTALGMEHVNETGVPDWKLDGSWWRQDNGFYNTNYFFFNSTSDRTWENFVNYSISANYPYTYDMKQIAAIAECLSRNRDENGDGRIDQNELKWYLPATNQLIAMFLGAKSLPSPLFDADKVSSVIYNDARYHYITSNKQKVWAEEGCSFGEHNYQNKTPQLLRCVRNLGLSNSAAVDNTVKDAYDYDSATRTFRMNKMANQNLRPGKVTGELVFHDNFSDTNRPYKAFQMATDFIQEPKLNVAWSSLFDIDTSHNTACSKYTEGGHTWRAPNQREFMIMFLQNKDNVKQAKNGSTYDGFTRTHWKYKTWRHFGINGDYLFLDGSFNNQTESATYNRTIRCVRDVD